MTQGTKTRTTRTKASAGDKLRAASTKIKATGSTAAKAAGEAYATARERTSETVRENPLTALFGGLAVGAILGAIIPRLKGEQKLLGKAGAKLNDSARKAAEAGRDKLGEMGINREVAREKVNDLLDKAAAAITTKTAASPAKAKAAPKAKAVQKAKPATASKPRAKAKA